MMFDINKLSTQQTTKTLNNPQGTMPKELSGKLAKLSSELKLIESLESIKINSTKDVVFQQKPAQILDVSTQSNKNFSLVNTQEKINVNNGDKIELHINKNQQSATLNILTQPAKTVDNKQNNTAISQQTQNPAQQASNPQNTAALSTQIKSTFLGNLRQSSSSIINQNTRRSTANDAQPNNKQTNNLDLQNSTSQKRSLVISSTGNSSPEQIKLSVTIATKAIPLTVLSITSNLSNNGSATSQTPLITAENTNIYTKTSDSLTPIKTFQEVATKAQSSINTQNKTPSSISAQNSSQQVNNSQNRTVQPQTYFIDVTDGIETFTIETRHRPEIGSKIPVMVDNKGQLQLIPQDVSNTQSRPVDEGLKVSLPKQLSLQEMTQFIKQLESLSLSNQLGSEKLQQTLAKLVSTIPNLNTLSTTPEALKQTFQQSGLFLENNLAKESPPATLEKDIKLNLLKLQAAVSETNNTRLPPQFELVEKAIERITTNQLKHLVDTVRNDTQILPLQLEIPIKHGTNTSYVQFEIDREEKEQDKENDKKRRWLVKLKFDFPETGKIEARLSIQENKASIIFVAENKETEIKIRSQLSNISENLRKKDIELEKLDCFCAPIQSEPKPKITNRLIDVRT